MPQGVLWRLPDAAPLLGAHHFLMTKRTYAVSWTDAEGHVFAGKLALGLTHVRLDGRSSAGAEIARIRHYGDLGCVAAERRNGRREIVVTWSGRQLSIAVLEGAGAYAELLENLRHRTQDASASAHLTEWQNVV
jgi:hypothetical protein